LAKALRAVAWRVEGCAGRVPGPRLLLNPHPFDTARHYVPCLLRMLVFRHVVQLGVLGVRSLLNPHPVDTARHYVPCLLRMLVLRHVASLGVLAPMRRWTWCEGQR